MSIDLTYLFEIESFYQEFTEPDRSGEDKPEEPTCKKCLEIESECQCDYYDRIEEVELAQERAEIAMSQLRPIEIEVRKMKVTI